MKDDWKLFYIVYINSIGLRRMKGPFAYRGMVNDWLEFETRRCKPLYILKVKLRSGQITAGILK